ncbi:carbamoyltransferase N-terminal domain-containing protein [Streptomyces sp. NPDC020362]|uniref:carbamoyltransferase family protein n=1 Tax=unclassified Streptomyces TaxID=2593676 RepID=UPI003411E986
MTAIVGISAFYHDSAAALVVDGELVAAAQEERFSRHKHDPAFPQQALSYLLDQAPGTVDAIAYYESPWLKRRRVRWSLLGAAPGGAEAFRLAVRGGIARPDGTERLIRAGLRSAGLPADLPVLWSRHHLSHAASAYYPSPFERAAVLTVDGVGEWATTGIFLGEGARITALAEQVFPHSLGLLYSAVTHFCGFKVDSGEYKLMGLAAYGDPGSPQTHALRELILERLVDVREDGSFVLDMRYFSFHRGGTIIDVRRWERLFGMERRRPESGGAERYANLALAVQQVTEEVMVRLARHARERTGADALCLAGGVALNCVANARVLHEAGFDRLWIQPAAGDAGGAVGAALAAHHLALHGPRPTAPVPDGMKAAHLGPDIPDGAVAELVGRYGAHCTSYDDFGKLAEEVAGELAEGKVVGWVQGRMEFGPRALGNRSILADPRNAAAKSWLNSRIKAREDFRPFAPSLLAEAADEYLEPAVASRYMLLTTRVRQGDDGSPIPAATHVDGTARHHTVEAADNPRFWQLIDAFRTRTGCAALVNTSFNVRGEPVVATADDAYRCFLRTGMDLLVIGDHLFRQADQSAELAHDSLPLD